jgi:hypothetical protein
VGGGVFVVGFLSGGLGLGGGGGGGGGVSPPPPSSPTNWERRPPRGEQRRGERMRNVAAVDDDA